MRAYVLHGIDDLRLEETALPEIKEREVLVKVMAARIFHGFIRQERILIR